MPQIKDLSVEKTLAADNDWFLAQDVNGVTYKIQKQNLGIQLEESKAGILDKLTWYYPLSEQFAGYNAKNSGALITGNIRQAKGLDNKSSLLCDGNSFLSFNSPYASDMNDYLLADVDFEFFGWVNFFSLSTFRTIFSKDNGSSRKYQLTYLDTQRLAFSLWSSNGGMHQLTANNLGIPLINTWYFFDVWYTVSTKTLVIQINNNPQLANSSVFSGTPIAGNAEFRIGALGAFNVYHHGKIFGLGFLKNNLLTTSERQFIYNNGTGRSLKEL